MSKEKGYDELTLAELDEGYACTLKLPSLSTDETVTRLAATTRGHDSLFTTRGLFKTLDFVFKTLDLLDFFTVI